MKEKVFSIPVEMVFKKFHCRCCGKKLMNEKIKRTVTKDDRDYFYFHERGTFPRHNVDVIDTRLYCPSCKKSYSFGYQKLITIIQKKEKTKILSDLQIQENYKYAYYVAKRKHKNVNRIVYIIFALLCGIISYFTIFNDIKEIGERLFKTTIFTVSFLAVAGLISLINNLSLKKKSKIRYTYDEKFIIEYLHTLSVNNKDIILENKKCHCYKCMKSFDSEDITEFNDVGNTALCPYCKGAAVLVESDHYVLDDKTLKDLNEYWY